MKLNWDKIIHDTYVDLYKVAEPSTDFDSLVTHAKETGSVDYIGRTLIPMNDYLITEPIMEIVLAQNITKFKIPKGYRQAFRNLILLGCSPKTKYED